MFSYRLVRCIYYGKLRLWRTRWSLWKSWTYCTYASLFFCYMIGNLLKYQFKVFNKFIYSRICSYILQILLVILSFVIDHFGRRPLILISCVGAIVCNILIFIIMYCHEIYKVKSIYFQCSPPVTSHLLLHIL